MTTATTDQPTRHRNHRLRQLGAILAAFAFVAVITLAMAAAFYAGRASAQRDQQALQNDVAGCRASYRSDLIDGPTLDGLAGVAVGDREAIAAAVDAADRETYDRLVLLSRKDPEEFLAQCRALYG